MGPKIVWTLKKELKTKEDAEVNLSLFLGFSFANTNKILVYLSDNKRLSILFEIHGSRRLRRWRNSPSSFHPTMLRALCYQYIVVMQTYEI